MTTRTVKIVTTILIVSCLVMLAAWPFVMGAQPATTAALAVKKAYVVRLVTLVCFIVLTLVLSAIGAVIIMRRTVAEVREAQSTNMQVLIESTLAAHKKRAEETEAGE
jgi:hypothetical protein